jgi:hypothetical protein
VKNFISRYIIQVTIIFTAIILVWVSANLNWGDGRWNKLLNSDAKGYYAYLPAVFIYHDLSFNFLGKNPDNPVLSAPFAHKAGPDKEGVINKYYAGTAVAQLPFFLAGHVTSMVLGRPLDGYSSYYLIFIQVAAIFYALLAQFLLFRILSELNISKKIIALVIFTAIFGTNIYYYIVIEPGVSHIYSFAFVALFALSAMRFFSKPSKKYFLLGMFAIGMVVLIRPVNMLVLLSVPFLAGSLNNLNSGFRFIIKHFLILLSGISVALLVVSIQLVIYKIQTGSFIVYSYGEEGFDFLHPNILNFILSYRKGLFVYTPVFFLSLLGLYTLYKQSAFSFFSLVMFLFIAVYVLSSWWMWYYGGSFGSRAFIDYYVYLLIPLALWLQFGKWRKFFIPLTFVFILVCMIQTIQYQYGYIHWSEMTKELYWDNFLRIDKVINGAKKQW